MISIHYERWLILKVFLANSYGCSKMLQTMQDLNLLND